VPGRNAARMQDRLGIAGVRKDIRVPRLGARSPDRSFEFLPKAPYCRTSYFSYRSVSGFIKELMTTIQSQSTAPLDEQHAEFSRNRFLAMPIAGAIAWTLIGIAGAFFPVPRAALALFIGTGMIFYLGLLVVRTVVFGPRARLSPPGKYRLTPYHSTGFRLREWVWR
jgi:hypothetical protein